MSPLKGFKDKETGGIVFKRGSNAGADMEVPCGQCLGCRIDKSQMWAARITHEASMWDDNCFITLTYRDKDECDEEQLKNGYHVPDDGSLNKKHFQKFIKRLRKFYNERRIRYYHCGEYGDKLDRPHYHACLFNLDFEDKQLFKQSEGNFLFRSQILEKLWPYGFSTVGALTFESAAYCARYILKKVTGIKSQDHYSRLNLETGEIIQLLPEYTTMSRRPGIGRDWYEKFEGDIWPSDEVPVPGKGILKKVPRYYEEILRKERPEELEAIKKVRQKYKKEHPEDFTMRRLEDKYKVKKAQITTLQRGYDNEV